MDYQWIPRVLAQGSRPPGEGGPRRPGAHTVRPSPHGGGDLREIGYDERTIADALGQKTIEMARHYAKGADLAPKMRAVVKSFDAELNKRSTKTVKPER
jgi:hypothetical protein